MKRNVTIALDEKEEILLEFEEGSILSKNDLSLLCLYINQVKDFAKTEYKRGFDEGYYDGKGY